MRDLVELVNSVDKNLPSNIRRDKICELLLQELQTLKGSDLSPYLSEFVFDMVQPGTRIVLKFPIGTHITDAQVSNFKR